MKILFPHPRLQNFPANALPFFSLCLIFFSFHSVSSCFFSFLPVLCLSVVAVVSVFPFLHSYFSCPLHFFLIFPFTCVFSPSFFPYPFCFCSSIISFLPVLSSVLYSHPSTCSLPLIILLFFAAVSFNAFFDTAYSLMIIRRSGDAGAMNFTNPALRASVHNHSSRSTGTES